MNRLYKAVMNKMVEKTGNKSLASQFHITEEMSEKIYIIPPSKTRYLSEISENNRQYDKRVNQQVEIAQKLFGIQKTIDTISETNLDEKEILINTLKNIFEKIKSELFKVLRKRTIECVLATDMALHSKQISQITSKIDYYSQSGEGTSFIDFYTDEKNNNSKFSYIRHRDCRSI